MRVLVYPIKLDSHRDKFKLFLGGDFHSGDANYDEDSANRFVETILESKKSDCITRTALMGDYIAEFPKGDKRGDNRIQKARIDPLAIYTDFRDFIKPISNTVVTCLTGNHDEDWWFENNIDYVNWMCAELDIPYGTYESYVRFKVTCAGSDAKRNIDFLLWHGSGGGRTAGGAFNKVRGTIESFRKPEVIAMGHLHRLGMLHEQWLDIDESEKDVVSKDQYFVLTGGYQKGYNPKSDPPTSSYISKKMLPPVAIGGVCLTIQPFRDVGGKDILDVQFSEVR